MKSWVPSVWAPFLWFSSLWVPSLRVLSFGSISLVSTSLDSISLHSISLSSIPLDCDSLVSIFLDPIPQNSIFQFHSFELYLCSSHLSAFYLSVPSFWDPFPLALSLCFLTHLRSGFQSDTPISLGSFSLDPLSDTDNPRQVKF